MTSEVRRLAHAKVNPFLRVLGIRPDGFHDLQTLIHPIDLADELTVRQRSGGLVLRVDGPEAAGVPAGSDNLVIRAAVAVAAACGMPGEAEILLTKRIPVAAGLGGGSADAAAIIEMLPELWGRELDPERRLRVAASVGSDVPAMLFESPVMARGRGEQVEPAEIAPCRWRVIPAGFGVSAADAFRWWDEDGGVVGPDPGPLMRALQEGDLDTAAAAASTTWRAPSCAAIPSRRRRRPGCCRRAPWARW